MRTLNIIISAGVANAVKLSNQAVLQAHSAALSEAWNDPFSVATLNLLGQFLPQTKESEIILDGTD